MTVNAQDPRIGTTLKDRWRIDALLGRGGMASVYAATHRNGKRVAIKILNPELSAIAECRERFLREGYVANKVDHPGAVTVDDDDVTPDGAAFLVMELLQGETLEQRRERAGGRLLPREVAGLVDQVLDTLASAHAKGIVHRDLKPENMFLTTAGAVKILDFGIARLREGAATKSATATGTLMGTPTYLPPEQARGRWADVDGRSDIWAVGATMFTLLSGRTVHDGETVNEVLLHAMTEAAPPIRSVAPDVPEELAGVVDRALQLQREQRWPDATAMRNALRNLPCESASPASTHAPFAPAPSLPVVRTLLAPTPLHVTTAAVTSPTISVAQKPSRLGAVGAVAAVVLAGIVGMAIWFFSTRRAEPSPAAEVAPIAPTVLPVVVRPAPSATAVAPAASAGVTAIASSTVGPATAAPISVTDLPDVTSTPSHALRAPSAPAPKPTAVAPATKPAPKGVDPAADPFSARR